jgi:hypothetical protein
MKKKNNFINYFLILISIVISLLIIEIFLYFDNRNFYEPVFYEKKIGEKTFILNSTKYKNEKLDQIVLFGDSFMLGKKCGIEKNLPSLISKDVKGIYNVINFGQPGVNSMQVFSNIKIFLAYEKIPKQVIIGFYSNDIHIDKSYCDFIEDIKKYNFFNKNDIDKLNLLCSKNNNIDKFSKFNWHKFGITQILNELIIRIFTFLDIKILNSRVKFYDDLKNTNSLENKLFRYSIIKINDILVKNNIKNVMFFFPNAENLNINSSISKSYDILSNKLNLENNINIFNGYKFFNTNKNISMTASILDKHSNCKYYEIIYNFFKENNLIIKN